MGHNFRQVVRVAPEVMEFLRRPGDRDGTVNSGGLGIYLRTGFVNPPGIEAQCAVEHAAASDAAIYEVRTEDRTRYTESGSFPNPPCNQQRSNSDGNKPLPQPHVFASPSGVTHMGLRLIVEGEVYTLYCHVLLHV